MCASFLLGQESASQSVFGSDWSEQKGTEETKRDLIFPNPTYGMLNFDLSNLGLASQVDASYRVVIRNVIAMKIFSVDFKGSSFKHDFSFLDKGTYLLSVEHMDGRQLFGRRLVIITP